MSRICSRSDLRLLGDAKFKPIWEKLDAYEAVVFVHPAAVYV